LQNIPKQDKERAKIIRKAFVAKEGYSLIEADYSQIEFRLWGHCSGDEKLLASLNKEGSDIHREVASKVFRVPIDKVTDTMRTIGKCATYGLVYGVSNFSLARDFNMEEEEVNRFMNNFYSAFPVAVNWVEGNIALMEKQGYVTNWAGRRRRATDIYSKVKELKAAAGRQARNSPMQGGAADLVNVAMIKTFKMLQPYGEGARLLLQIHDSLELEVRDDLLVELLPKIQYSMENAVQMKCKTPVVPEVGKNLGEMKKVRVREGKLEVLIEVKEDKKEVWEEYKI
jgi:DNA polymerase-1